MAMVTVATLKRMSREQLSDLLLSENASKVAVVDVRDDDHVGGHISGSRHVPSSKLDHRIPEIVSTLHGTEIVVFHCALSQQRGPSAALRYMREKENQIKKVEYEKSKRFPRTELNDGESKQSPSGEIEQQVYVLDQGFVGWQEKYESTVI